MLRCNCRRLQDRLRAAKCRPYRSLSSSRFFIAVRSTCPQDTQDLVRCFPVIAFAYVYDERNLELAHAFHEDGEVGADQG